MHSTDAVTPVISGYPHALESIFSPADSEKTLQEHMDHLHNTQSTLHAPGHTQGSTRRPPVFRWAGGDAKDDENEDFIYGAEEMPDPLRSRGSNSLLNPSDAGTTSGNSVIPHLSHNPTSGPKLKRSTEFKPPTARSQNGERSSILSPTIYGTLAISSPGLTGGSVGKSANMDVSGQKQQPWSSTVMLSTSTSDSSSTSSHGGFGSMKMSTNAASQKPYANERAALLAPSHGSKHRDPSIDSQDSRWRGAAGARSQGVVGLPLVNPGVSRGSIEVVTSTPRQSGFFGSLFGLGRQPAAPTANQGNRAVYAALPGGMATGPRSSRSMPLYSTRMERRRLARRRAQEKRRWRSILLALFIALVSAFGLALCFSTLPLSIPSVIVPSGPDVAGEVVVPSWGLMLDNITASKELYAFDLELQAVNWNVIPADIVSLDLNIYASADAVAYNASTMEELLGHVKYFDDRVRFPAAISSNATGRISLKDPSNTIGRIIYMFYPYRLTLVGEIMYSTTGPMLGQGKMFNPLFEHSVNVCSIHVVEAIDRISSYACDPMTLQLN
ncbi:hypothetical protein HDU97_001120 [Phlyctochytrium planicorne]|nr:hypothetical protein HDU97_001120 [Phlyctochytrium planicorne]